VLIGEILGGTTKPMASWIRSAVSTAVLLVTPSIVDGAGWITPGRLVPYDVLRAELDECDSPEDTSALLKEIEVFSRDTANYYINIRRLLRTIADTNAASLTPVVLQFMQNPNVSTRAAAKVSHLRLNIVAESGAKQLRLLQDEYVRSMSSLFKRELVYAISRQSRGSDAFHTLRKRVEATAEKLSFVDEDLFTLGHLLSRNSECLPFFENVWKNVIVEPFSDEQFEFDVDLGDMYWQIRLQGTRENERGEILISQLKDVGSGKGAVSKRASAAYAHLLKNGHNYLLLIRKELMDGHASREVKTHCITILFHLKDAAFLTGLLDYDKPPLDEELMDGIRQRSQELHHLDEEISFGDTKLGPPTFRP